MPSSRSPSETITYVKWAISSSPKRSASMRSPSARPTAVEMPWPSGPVVVSIPGAWPYSGCPAAGEFSWRKFLMSSSETP